MSKLIESLRDDMATLLEAGAIDILVIREFDALCPPQVSEINAEDGLQTKSE